MEASREDTNYIPLYVLTPPTHAYGSPETIVEAD